MDWASHMAIWSNFPVRMEDARIISWALRPHTIGTITTTHEASKPELQDHPYMRGERTWAIAIWRALSELKFRTAFP